MKALHRQLAFLALGAALAVPALAEAGAGHLGPVVGEPIGRFIVDGLHGIEDRLAVLLTQRGHLGAELLAAVRVRVGPPVLAELGHLLLMLGLEVLDPGILEDGLDVRRRVTVLVLLARRRPRLTLGGLGLVHVHRAGGGVRPDRNADRDGHRTRHERPLQCGAHGVLLLLPGKVPDDASVRRVCDASADAFMKPL